MEDIRCEGERGRGREEGTRDGGAYVEGRVCGIYGERAAARYDSRVA